jgi:hypothetical protein
VFLGTFSTPPSANEVRLLSQWDLIVLDPLQSGVLNAISSHCTSTHIVGRLDVGKIVKSSSSSSNKEIIRALGIVLKTLIESFRRAQDAQSPFTGVMLTNWLAHFPLAVCNGLVKHINSLGLDVFLEICGPVFLSASQCRIIDMEQIKGIAIRNGSILPNGEQRNFFQMSNMRPAMRALAVQACIRDTVLMLWETLEDDAVLQHAVAKRSFIWGRYNSAVNWIGHKGALTDAEIAKRRTLPSEPLGALMWLKSDEVMKMHATWKSNDKVRVGS